MDRLFCDDESLSVSSEVANFSAKVRTIKPSKLAKVWRIKIDNGKRTLGVTSQLMPQDCDGHIARDFTTNDRRVRYRRIRHYFFTDTFFVTKKARSWGRGNRCMQIFVSDMGFIFVVAMKSKSFFPQALKRFAKEVGVPPELICDASRE